MIRDSFARAALTGPHAMSLAPQERQRIARECITSLDHLEETDNHIGETAISLIMQPLFALSGYKLQAQPVKRDHHTFDLEATNIIGGDDHILVDYKFNREGKPRTLIPASILDILTGLTPADPTRAIMLSPEGFDWKATSTPLRRVGPRLELWSFKDVRSRLEGLLADGYEQLDIVVKLVLDMVENLALAIARSEANLRQVEWRDLERMIAHVLSELGYAVTLTRSARDGGKDVIVADFTGNGLAVFNIEIKHWTTERIGAAEVRRLLDVSVREGRDGALLLATSGVGPAAVSARGELQTQYLRFGSERKMVMTCRALAQKRGGLWTGPRPFRTYLLEDTE